jgi:hypothetical protein
MLVMKKGEDAAVAKRESAKKVQRPQRWRKKSPLKELKNLLEPTARTAQTPV